MVLASFTSWQRRRQSRDDLTPESDKVVPLVAQAGRWGMSRCRIGRVIELEPDVLNNLLTGLVQAGLLRSSWANGVQVFRD